jgi:predicted AAA+ superfamily ATPase
MEIPLEGAADKTYFKVYMSDIGLLRAKSKVSVQTILEESDLYIRYKGAFAENYVLNELRVLGKTPFFWRSGNSAEVDFIFEEDGEIVPVEVKSADNTQAKSYRQFCKKYQPKKGVKLSRKNIAQNLCESTETYNIPLYLEWNIEAYIRSFVLC